MTASCNMQVIGLVRIMSKYDTHPLGESRYEHQGTQHAAPGCVINGASRQYAVPASLGHRSCAPAQDVHCFAIHPVQFRYLIFSKCLTTVGLPRWANSRTGDPIPVRRRQPQSPPRGRVGQDSPSRPVGQRATAARRTACLLRSSTPGAGAAECVGPGAATIITVH